MTNADLPRAVHSAIYACSIDRARPETAELRDGDNFIMVGCYRKGKHVSNVMVTERDLASWRKP